MRRCARVGAALTAALATLAVALATLASRADASTTQVSIIQDDPQLLRNPAATMLRFRQLGAQQVRVAIRWQSIAPSPNSFTAPRGFSGANPANYSKASWAPYDAIARDALTEGIQVNFNVVGGAPLWATGPGMPHTIGYPFHNWEPNAVDFGQFMQALGTRYSGSYNPATKRLAPRNKNDLPRVSFWSIWNEPDYGPSLAPQALPGHPALPGSPRMYRELVGKAWTALRLTGHGRDKVLVGELAPRATSTPFGLFNGMLPTTFVQSLYCLGSNGKPLTGVTAALEGCPATAQGSRRFVADNPALFQMTGFSDHPYMRWFPPNDEQNVESTTTAAYPKSVWASLVRGYTTLGTIGNLISTVDRSLAAYGSHRRVPIWNTEFGYITSPPKRVWSGNPFPYVSPATAAYYNNWAEYLSWKNPQIASFEQYLLYDPLPATKATNYGEFASGLLYYGGRQKQGYAAWRLPLYMPTTTTSSSRRALMVWGDVRPIDYAALDLPYGLGTAQLLFQPGGKGRYILLDTVPVRAPDGYFDKPVLFPRSGILVMRWYYPIGPGFGPAAGAAVFSRPIQVTVK